MRDGFKQAIVENQNRFGLDLNFDAIERLADFYEACAEQNRWLHLVAPCSPEEFATRHVLESLTMLRHLPRGGFFTDVGSGGGLPAVPCLIARADLKGRLIESKEKKAEFLEKALARLGLASRAEVLNAQFTESDPGDAAFVTCRALDKFTERLQRLIRWSGGRSLLLFGGEPIGRLLKKYGINAVPELMPLSERRYLFVAVR